MKNTIILDKIAMLPESMKDELDSFLDALLERSKVKVSKKPRKAGFLAEMIEISADFEESLQL